MAAAKKEKTYAEFEISGLQLLRRDLFSGLYLKCNGSTFLGLAMTHFGIFLMISTFILR